MKQEAYDILKTAIAEHRELLLSGRQTCLGLLRDYGGRDHPEVNLFAEAVEENIPDRLIRSQPVTQQIIDSLAGDFASKRLYESQAAKFVVSSWADALGLLTLEPSILTNSRTAAEHDPESLANEATQPVERSWYYQDGTITIGPLVESRLKGLCKSGRLQANSQVWSEGMDKWGEASTYFPQVSIPPLGATASQIKTGQPRNLVTSQSTLVTQMSWSTILWSFKGRISRRTYWLATGAWLAIIILFSIIAASNPDAEGPAIFLGLLCLLFIWSSIAIQVKRWHDRNKSGFMVLIGMIPYIGAIWSLIECGCLRGTVGDNKYGKETT